MIQHPRRNDGVSEAGLPLLLQREQIQQHLDPQPVPHIRQIEGLAPRLIVHHPQIQLPVVEPAVHPVHFSADGEGGIPLLNGDGRQCAVPSAEAQLKSHGLEIRFRQFLRHAVHDILRRGAQSPEQIAESGALFLVTRYLVPDVKVNIFTDHSVQLRRFHRRPAAAACHLTGGVLQQIVQKRPDLRGLEARRAPLLGPQAVLHKVAEVALPHPVHPGCGHPHPGAVQGLHRRRGQPSPPQLSGPLHGRQRPGVLLSPGKVPPQRAAHLLTGLLQRHRRGQQTHRLPLRHQARKQPLQPPHHKGGPQLSAAVIRHRIAHRQMLRLLGQTGIDVLQFVVQRVKGRIRQQNVSLLQNLPLLRLQQAVARRRLGQHMVVGPQQKQPLHRVPVVAGQLADLHLIQRCRNGPHAVLGQHQPQKPGKFLAGELHLPQNLRHLIQYAAQDPPQLAVFLRQLGLSLPQQLLCRLLQALRHAGLLGKYVKHFRFIPGLRPVLQAIAQGQQRRAHLLPYAVDLRQPLLPLRGHLLPVSVGVCRPLRVPQPHIPPDAPQDHIVLQQVAFLRRDARHPRLEIAEHILPPEAAGNGIHRPQQHGQGRLCQNIAAAADIRRDAIPLKNALDDRAVYLHAPGGNGNVPPAAGPGGHQLPDLRRRPFHLAVYRAALPQRHLLPAVVPLIGHILPQQVLLQMGQRPLSGAGEPHDLALRPQLPGHPLQPLPLT